MPKIKKLHKVQKGDRKPGEVLTRAFAIRSFCLLCCDNNSAEVRRCPNKECHLYPYRLGIGGLYPEISKEKEKYGENFPNNIDYGL